MISKPAYRCPTQPTPRAWRETVRLVRFKCLTVLPLILASVTAAPAAGPSVEIAKANRVKVAYLYNFTRYVEWPAKAFEGETTPFVIGVLGEDPFGRSLDKIAKKRHQATRPIVVQRYTEWSSERPCHVLFLSSAIDAAVREQAVSETRNDPLLIVSDVGLTGPPPAPLNLYLDGDGTIGFEINVTETRLRGLKVNAKLLKLARVVNTPADQTPQAAAAGLLPGTWPRQAPQTASLVGRGDHLLWRIER